MSAKAWNRRRAVVRLEARAERRGGRLVLLGIDVFAAGVAVDRLLRRGWKCHYDMDVLTRG